MQQLEDQIGHCFSRDGKYYQVRLGLNKQLNEVHGFYVDAGTVVAFENTDEEGAGFSQISGTLPANGNNEILVPKAEELLRLFPQQRGIIKKLTANMH